MKKALFLLLILSSICSFSQTKSELIKIQRDRIETAIQTINDAKEAIESIKMNNDSINIINPSTLTTKKAVLMIGQKDSISGIVYYLNFGAKSLKINSMILRVCIGENWYFLTPSENGFVLKTYEEMTTVNTIKLK